MKPLIYDFNKYVLKMKAKKKNKCSTKISSYCF